MERTPIEASQRLKNGSRTVALICPQADTIRLIAAPMVGEVDISCSAFILESVPCSGLWVWVEVGKGRGAGKSREGKSSPLHDLEEGKTRVEALGVGALGDEGGVGVWKWTCVSDGVWAGDFRVVELAGDVGGVVYPVIVIVIVIVGGGVEGAARGTAASAKTRSMSSSASPTMVCSARSTSNVVDIG